MTDIVVRFTCTPTRVGLIVRGKLSPGHHPDLMQQHADAILSDGSPTGFYGEGNDNSSNRIGMVMQGIVYDYQALLRERPYYVKADAARSYRLVSTVLLIQVTPVQARSFRDAWTRMTDKPGHFNIVGGNCSTHASAAFIEAGILKGGIPGLDTPDALYGQIVKTLPAASLQSLSGFIGFTQAQGGGYDLRVIPHVDTPSVAKPNPGSLGGLSRAAA